MWFLNHLVDDYVDELVDELAFRSTPEFTFELIAESKSFCAFVALVT